MPVTENKEQKKTNLIYSNENKTSANLLNERHGNSERIFVQIKLTKIDCNDNYSRICTLFKIKSTNFFVDWLKC